MKPLHRENSRPKGAEKSLLGRSTLLKDRFVGTSKTPAASRTVGKGANSMSSEKLDAGLSRLKAYTLLFAIPGARRASAD